MHLASPRTARIDFHLHSRASNVTDYYAANAFSIPESYSDPHRVYEILKRRGMDLVTLTDHNAIAGALELKAAGHEDVFLSSELTCTFPEDGCHIHVTVTNVTEAQFAEANRLRANVYELIAWLRQLERDERPDGNHVAWFMTHPLMSTGNRPYGRDGALGVEHIEKMLVLCDAFEIQNGSRTRALNELTADLLRSLTPATLARLADKHRLTPHGPTPWLKATLGGSDDHAGINPGHTWTSFPVLGDRLTPNGLVAAIRARRVSPGGAHGGPVTLAHALLKLLYDGGELRRASGEGGGLGLAGPLQQLLRAVFGGGPDRWSDQLRFLVGRWTHAVRAHLSTQPRAGRRFEDVLSGIVYDLLGDADFRERLAATPGTDDRIFLVLGSLVNRLFSVYLDHLQELGRDDLVKAVKEVVALLASTVLLSLPYFISFLQQSSDCLITRDVRRSFDLPGPRRLVLFTDTFFEINGVSGTIRRMIAESARRGIDLVVVTALSPERLAEVRQDPTVNAWIEVGRLKVFPAVKTLAFPEYEGLHVQFPSLLEMLRFVQEEGFTKMQISTPGTVGLCGLAIARLLQIETAATYHTSFPEYVENYTRDVSLEALAWKYMILFYHSVDEVIVPSRFVARLLHQRGLRNRKLLVLDRWVDTRRFHPDKRSPGYWQARGAAEGAITFLYVGRLGVEKNLTLVAEAFRRLAAQRSDVHLALVGGGPFRADLERQLAGLPVTFAGFLEGEELATAIASADVKVFPSTTDTWGNAPLEAQASGLPVIVSNVGGPCELMEDGVTGHVVTGHDPGPLYEAMAALCDRDIRARMGAAARAFVERNEVPQPFTAILDAEAYRASLKTGRHAARAVLTFPTPDEEVA